MTTIQTLLVIVFVLSLMGNLAWIGQTLRRRSTRKVLNAADLSKSMESLLSSQFTGLAVHTSTAIPEDTAYVINWDTLTLPQRPFPQRIVMNPDSVAKITDVP